MLDNIGENEDFTEKEVVDYVIKNSFDNLPNGKQSNLDPRNLLINILYHNFYWTEEQLATLFNKERSTMTHSKNKAFELWGDESFAKHTENVRNTFPSWIPPNPDNYVNRDRRVIMHLSRREYEVLENVRRQLNMKDASIARVARFMLFIS